MTLKRRRIRGYIVSFAVGAVFLAVCGWFVRAAGPDRKFNQGLAYLRANRPEETRYCLISIENRAGYQSQASLLRGWLRMQSRGAHKPEDYPAIWADLSDALEYAKCRPLTLSLMGRLLYEGGRYANALSVLQGALAEDPDEIEAHRWLGSALYDLGAVVPAVDHLKRVADREVTNGRICRLLGLIYQNRGAHSEAAAAYQQSLARSPEQPDSDLVRIELARCQVALEDYDAALSVLQDCADSGEALALRGICFLNEGNRQRAQRCVTEALRQNAENAAALDCLAMLDPAAAVGPLTRALENTPNDVQLRQHLVAAYRALGQEELADKQQRQLRASQELQAKLDALLVQANENLFDVSLRYQIAETAQRLGRAQLAHDWLRAAQMLDSPTAVAPLPSLVTPPRREE